ncbi:lipoate--protein ligase family protein [Enterococcus diestrammenae]|uniref:lipoate--protein ligase family protein n=1 Tax=Enterococcus diestrammenae TaxID=1155073 RepID=UPI0022E1B289|nr:lipoate--protein ligase family protein [Enterococcus diestrammenae]
MQPSLILNQVVYPPEQQVLPFALTDVLTEYTSLTGQSLLHFWQLTPTMILGMKDTRVPHLSAALATLTNQQLQVVVRNSGGLGVICDEGVLNITLFLPLTEKKLSTDAAYDAMYQLTQQAFPELTITTGEVADSYCPGEYDLSVNGRKIAGIAQRRLKQGVAVMMYLSVSGDQQNRGQIVRHFYQAGLAEGFGTAGYPPVNPDSMTTLTRELGQELTIHDCQARFATAYAPQALSLASDQWLATHEELADSYQRRITSMLNRNQEIKELIHDDHV